MKTLDVDEWLTRLWKRIAPPYSTALAHVSEHPNSFEDWLKFEMARTLQERPFSYKPIIHEGPGDVGVEYRARLRGGRESKLIDLWASPVPRAKEWVFVELKVAFNNYNCGKQIASWHSDFLALRQIDDSEELSRPHSIASVLFGVGFSAAAFRKVVRAHDRTARVDADWLPGRLHVAVLDEKW